MFYNLDNKRSKSWTSIDKRYSFDTMIQKWCFLIIQFKNQKN